jgi:hypothetical protein
MSFNNNTPISYVIEEIEQRQEKDQEIESKANDIIDANDLKLIEDYTSREMLNDIEEFNTHILNYQENFTVKELSIICDYYELNIKKRGYIKDVIIEILVSFELDKKNADIVSKRQTAWFFMNELKNDAFMRTYVTSLRFPV